MKKFIIIIMLLLSSACQLQTVETDKFVNPLFYKTMSPLGTVGWEWDMILTPTKITLHNTKTDTFVEQKCYLMENTEMSVTFNCEGMNEPTKRKKVVCTRMPEVDKPYYGGGYVLCKTAFEFHDKKGS